MPLAAGARLGHFEVLAPLGAGGMGEVYRARDIDLGRDVALKVLPDEVARDHERLARFEREGRVLAALNHPGILVVFEVGDQDGKPFVVSELLEGETLRQALARLTLRQALDYAAQVASGLAAAHEKGVVHRDLKPENLFVTRDGRVKILDFGLAKVASSPGHGRDTAAETLSSPTTPGTVWGSAGYMAPEQVRGEEVDHRADVFSLGVVLYELLTGRRAFRGNTIAETLTAILREDPPELSELAPHVPPGVWRVVKRCLEKRPEDRFQSARDVGFALEVGADPDPTRRAGTQGPARRARVAIGAAVAGCLGGLLLSRLATVPPTPAVTPRRLTIETPSSAPLSDDVYVPFALSPDGTTLAFVTSQPERLFLRRLDTFEATPVEGTEGAYDPFFSPDGQWVGFWAYGKLKKIPVAGGPAVTLCDAYDMLGASWGENGTIVFAGNDESLSIVSADGGTPRPLTKLDPARHEVQHAFPQLLPGGRAVLFTATARSTSDPYSVEAQDLATGERHTVVPGARYGRYLPTGHVVYARGTTVFAVPVRRESLRVEGPGVAVLENVAAGPAGEALLSVAPDGTLAFVPGGPRALRTLVWADRNGVATTLGIAPRLYEHPRLSPDGRRVAVSLEEAGRLDIWIYTFEQETLERLTFDRTVGLGFDYHTFTPDGARITYTVDSPDGFRVVSAPVDASGSPEDLLSWAARIAPHSWLRDGQALLLNELGATTGGDLLVFRPGTEPRVTPFVQEPGNQWGASASPDGRYVAYAGDETGRFEIYVRPFPGPGPKRQLTTEGGEEPVWSRDGRELFYRSGQRLMVIPIATSSPLQSGRPRLVFEGRFVKGDPGLPAYDVSPDARRFLMMKNEHEAQHRELRVILNWFEDLKRRVP